MWRRIEVHSIQTTFTQYCCYVFLFKPYGLLSSAESANLSEPVSAASGCFRLAHVCCTLQSTLAHPRLCAAFSHFQPWFTVCFQAHEYSDGCSMSYSLERHPQAHKCCYVFHDLQATVTCRADIILSTAQRSMQSVRTRGQFATLSGYFPRTFSFTPMTHPLLQGPQIPSIRHLYI